MVYGQPGAQSGIPETAGANGVFRTVRRSNVGGSRKQIISVRKFLVFWLRFFACFARGQAQVDPAVVSFVVVGKAALGVVDGNRLLRIVSCPGAHCPVPSVAADFAAIEKVVESH